MMLKELLGQELDQGRYRIDSKLGEGGFGSVFKARDQRLDCNVVVKVPLASIAADPNFRERFQREFAAIINLTHPHIVKVQDLGEHDGFPYAVMQYLSGGSLADQKKKNAANRNADGMIGDRLDWLPAIATALDFIHSRGFIHRDIKPGNILLDEHGFSFLSDFGLAKVIAHDDAVQRDATLTAAGMAMGTPQYMAPEFAEGATITKWVDQYALAITVYELLTGRCPIQGSSPLATVFMQKTETPKPLRELGFDPVLSDVVAKALNKNPMDRFASCSDFADAIPIATKSLVPSKTPAPSKTPDDKVRVVCPNCSAKLKCHRRQIGSWIVCPGCKNRFHLGKKPNDSQPISDTPIANDTRPIRQSGVDTSTHALASPAGSVSRATNGNLAKTSSFPRTTLLVLTPVIVVTAAIAWAAVSMLPTNEAAFKSASSSNGQITDIVDADEQFETSLDPEFTANMNALNETARPPEPPTQTKSTIETHVATKMTAATNTGNESVRPSEQLIDSILRSRSTGMVLARVPAGRFLMGSPSDEVGRDDNEDQHDENVNEFYIGRFEVTQDEYEHVMGDNPSSYTDTSSFGVINAGRLPVESVSWFDAVEFCNQLSLSDGKRPRYEIISSDASDPFGGGGRGDDPFGGAASTVTVNFVPDADGYRLPSEIEWEYACRGGMRTRFHFGDQIRKDQANFGHGRNRRRSEANPKVVGSFAPNPFKLFDMHGNVSEWCEDTDGELSAIRGGSWADSEEVLRSAYRFADDAKMASSDTGFRVVLD